tara:strand:- start:4570 stop:5853 length:1284 start_codon:yes stop_codon:yes gene_type:complete
MLVFMIISLVGLNQAAANVDAGDIAISLEQSLEMARKNSEDIQLQLNNLEIKQAQYRQALGTALPQITTSANWLKFYKNPVNYGQSLPIEHNASATVSVDQVLWAFGKVGSALKAARASLKMGDLEKQLTIDEVDYMTKLAYYNVLYTKSQLKIAKQSLQNARQNLSILQKKYSGGRPPQGDLIRLRSDVALRIPQVKSAEANYQQARMTLAQILGMSLNASFKLTSDFKENLPHFDVAQSLDKMQKSQLQLEFLEQSVEYSKQAAKVQRSAYFPTLSAVGAYTYTGASQDNLSAEDFDESVYAGISISWNLWDGGSSIAKYREALKEQTAAEINLQKTKEQLTLKLKTNLEIYESLRSSLKSSYEAVSLAEKSFGISQRRFATGKTSVTEMNSTEAALTQARSSLAANMHQAHVTLALLQNLLARN